MKRAKRRFVFEVAPAVARQSPIGPCPEAFAVMKTADLVRMSTSNAMADNVTLALVAEFEVRPDKALFESPKLERAIEAKLAQESEQLKDKQQAVVVDDAPTIANPEGQ